MDSPIDSLEEQDKAATIMRRQHAEVASIVENEASNLTLQVPVNPEPKPRHLTAYEKLCQLPGAERVFRMDINGNFVDAQVSDQFRESMKNVFRNINDLVEVFIREPGVGMTREKGVYEVERDRLYLASAGAEFYFILVKPPNRATDYERIIKEIVDPTPIIEPYRRPT